MWSRGYGWSCGCRFMSGCGYRVVGICALWFKFTTHFVSGCGCRMMAVGGGSGGGKGYM